MFTTKIVGAVKQFPYRTARIDNSFLSVPRNLVSDLEHAIAEAAGVNVDNHTVYEIVQDDEKPPVYIRFSDFTATFAHTVREERW